MMPNFVAYPSAGNATDHPLSPSSQKKKMPVEHLSPPLSPTKKAKEKRSKEGKNNSDLDSHSSGAEVDAPPQLSPNTPKTFLSEATTVPSPSTPTKAGFPYPVDVNRDLFDESQSQPRTQTEAGPPTISLDIPKNSLRKHRKLRKSSPPEPKPEPENQPRITVSLPDLKPLNRHRLDLAGLDSVTPKSEDYIKPCLSVSRRREIFRHAANNLLSAKRISELVPDENEARKILEAAAMQGDGPVPEPVVLDAPPKSRKGLFSRKTSTGAQDSPSLLATSLSRGNRSGSVTHLTDIDESGKYAPENACLLSATSRPTSLYGGLRRSHSVKTHYDEVPLPSLPSRPRSIFCTLRSSFPVTTNVDMRKDYSSPLPYIYVEAPEEPLEEQKLGDHIDHSWKTLFDNDENQTPEPSGISFVNNKKRAAKNVQNSTKAMQKSLDAMQKTVKLLENASDEVEMERLIMEIDKIKADVDQVFEANGKFLPDAKTADKKIGERSNKTKDWKKIKEPVIRGFPSMKSEIPVFVYGTLMCPDILARVAHISYPMHLASWMTPSILKGFARFGIRGIQNPGMVPVMSWEQKRGVETKIGEPIIMGHDGELNGQAATAKATRASIERNINKNMDGRGDDFQVNGMLVFGLSEDKFNKLDKFAGGMYQKSIVQVWVHVRPAGTPNRSPPVARPSAWTCATTLPLTPSPPGAIEHTPSPNPYKASNATPFKTPSPDDRRRATTPFLSSSSTRKSSLQNLRSRATSTPATPPALRTATEPPVETQDPVERMRVRAIIERTRLLRFGPMLPISEQTALDNPACSSEYDGGRDTPVPLPQFDGPNDSRGRPYASPEDFMGPAAATMHRLASASLSDPPRNDSAAAGPVDAAISVPVLAWAWIYVDRYGDLVPPSRAVWNIEELLRTAG